MGFAIFVDYVLQGKTKWEHIELDPHKYIDDDSISIESWAQWLNAADFLRVDECELKSTIVRIFKKSSDQYLTLKWTHWNGGKSWVFELNGYYDRCEQFEITVKNEVMTEHKIENHLKLVRNAEGTLDLIHHSASVVDEEIDRDESLIRHARLQKSS